MFCMMEKNLAILTQKELIQRIHMVRDALFLQQLQLYLPKALVQEKLLMKQKNT